MLMFAYPVACHRCGDVVVSEWHSTTYLEEMRSARFCGVFPGNGWGHIEAPLMLGCIPVVVSELCWEWLSSGR